MMFKKRTWQILGLAAGLVFGLTQTGCFNNPVDPVTTGGAGGGGNIPVNTGDTTTTSIDSSYSQADSSGIYISVRDQDGNALGANYFNSNNFLVEYNGTLINSGSITVNTASGAGQSISSSLVLDYSGSMGTQDIADMETAAVGFVNNMQAADRGEIVKFGTTVVLEQAYTADKAALSTAITGVTTAGGSTALYDAIYLGLQNTTLETGQRAVVAFTDGGDNASTQTQASTVAFATTNGIPVYTIGLGGANDGVLQSIATLTYGQYYRAPTSADLANIYSRIAQIFNNTLILSWPSFVYRSGDTITILVTYSCSTGTYTSTINIVLP